MPHLTFNILPGSQRSILAIHWWLRFGQTKRLSNFLICYHYPIWLLASYFEWCYSRVRFIRYFSFHVLHQLFPGHDPSLLPLVLPYWKPYQLWDGRDKSERVRISGYLRCLGHWSSTTGTLLNSNHSLLYRLGQESCPNKRKDAVRCLDLPRC